jgi:hypothetical protein
MRAEPIYSALIWADNDFWHCFRAHIRRGLSALLEMFL